MPNHARARWARMVAVSAVALLGISASLHAQSNQLRVLFSDNPNDASDAKRDLLLRPNTEQSFYIFVENPTKTEKKVSVQIQGGNPPADIVKSGPVTIAPGKSEFVRLGKPPAKQDKPAPPAFQTDQGPFDFQVVLLDANGKALERHKVSANLLQPHQYLRVVASFDGATNRLNLRVAPKPEFAGPPCPVELALAPELSAQLLPGKMDGNLNDEVRTGQTADLFVQNL